MSYTPDPTRSAKNFMAHGGNELVIGGKLTLLTGAVVDDPSGVLGSKPAAASVSIKPSSATTVGALRDDYNRMIEALVAAGILALVDDAKAPTE